MIRGKPEPLSGSERMFWESVLTYMEVFDSLPVPGLCSAVNSTLLNGGLGNLGRRSAHDRIQRFVDHVMPRNRHSYIATPYTAGIRVHLVREILEGKW